MLLLFGGPKRASSSQEKELELPDLESDRRRVSHCEKAPLPEFSDLPDVFMEYDEFYEEIESSASDGGGSVFEIVHQFQSNSNRRSRVILSGISTYLKKQQKYWHFDSKTKTALEPELQFYRTTLKVLLLRSSLLPSNT